MNHLRATIRILALCALSFAMYVLVIAGSGFSLLFAAGTHRWRGIVFRAWAKTTVALLGIKITARGTPPESPFFLVTNHLSYLDIVVIGALADCAFIAKSEVRRWPVIGPLCRSVGTIFINRENRRDIARVNLEIQQALAKGRGVVLFAEGTSSRGNSVSAFKPGLLEQAARAGLEVSYASLSYRVPAGQTPAHLSVCWWGDMTFFKHLMGMLRLPEIYADITFGSQTIRESNRKTLALKLRNAVVEQFIPVVGPEEECATALNRRTV